jgi:CelD/BcsL family acetyltransferase involved in cellulose biosynthesis
VVSTRSTLDPNEVQTLWHTAATATVFNHPAWWQSAIDAFGVDRRMHVIRITEGSRTVAIWPLWFKRLGAKEGFARILEPVGARVTDYCQPLLARDHDQATLVSLLLREAALALDAQTLLYWPKVPMSLDGSAHINTALAPLSLLVSMVDRPCQAMTLPADYATLETSWSKSHRGDVRRQIKRLNAAGQLELVHATSRDDVTAMLPRLYAMHTANWKARTGYSELQSSPMTMFVAKIAAALPLALIDASEVRLDGIAIACHFGFRHDGQLLWYKPAFDVAWANYAPGKVHTALAARHGVTTGLTKFDFMQGSEAYKLLWSDLTTLTKSFVIARPIAYPLWAWNTKVRKFAAEYRY